MPGFPHDDFHFSEGAIGLIVVALDELTIGAAFLAKELKISPSS
jgi:hypothetical protein